MSNAKTPQLGRLEASVAEVLRLHMPTTPSLRAPDYDLWLDLTEAYAEMFFGKHPSVDKIAEFKTNLFLARCFGESWDLEPPLDTQEKLPIGL